MLLTNKFLFCYLLVTRNLKIRYKHLYIKNIKGSLIFEGTKVRTAYPLELVLFAGNMPGKSGNCVITLAPGWRLHYYAHLDEVSTHPLAIGGEIGTVGNTGNASNTPSHLHFGCATIYPRIWDIDGAPHGVRKCFYLNPIPQLNEAK